MSTSASSPPREHRLPQRELPDSLRPFVHEVYEVAYPIHPGGPYRLATSAGITPILNVTLAGRAWAELADGTGFWVPPVFLSGPQPDAYAVTIYGALRGFYATFSPVGPLALLGVRRYWRGSGAPLALAAAVRPALAEAAQALEAALFGTADFDARAALTLRFLLDAQASAPAADLAAAAFLQDAVAAVEAADGRLRVEDLACRLSVSAPTLRRRFAVVGVPVKRFAEIVRFRRAHAFLHATPHATWSDVVDRFGYADQAHFIRAYRRMAGVPPTRYEAEERPIDRRLGLDGPPQHPA